MTDFRDLGDHGTDPGHHQDEPADALLRAIVAMAAWMPPMKTASRRS